MRIQCLISLVASIALASLAEAQGGGRTSAAPVKEDLSAIEAWAAAEVVLDPERTWRGTLGRWNDTPVSTAVVLLELTPATEADDSAAAGVGRSFWGQPPAVIVVARSAVDEQGRFTLPAIAAAPNGTEIRIRAVAPYLAAPDLVYGMAEGRLHSFRGASNPNQERVQLNPVPGGRLRLRLQLPSDASEAERKALAGRRVFVQRISDSLNSTVSFNAVDETGAVTGDMTVLFDGVAHGRYKIVALRDSGDPSSGLVPFWVDRVEAIQVEIGETCEARVHLNRGVTVGGAVRDDGGNGVPGVRISAFGKHGEWGRLVTGDECSTTTDANGEFTLFDAPAPLRSLRASRPGWRSATVDAGELSRCVSTESRLAISLSSGLSLQGRATFPDESPVPDAYLAVKTPDDPSRWGTPVRTDADGRFQVSGLAPGLVEVSVGPIEHRGQTYVARATVEVSATSSGTPVDLVLRRPATLRGRVTDALGGTFEQVKVYVGGGQLVDGQSTFDDRTSPRGARPYGVDPFTGEFEVAELPLGPIGVFAQVGRGRHTRTSDLLVFEDTEDVPRFELPLRVLGQVQGVVRDSEGTPLAGVSVQLSQQRDSWRKEWAFIKTGEAGEFSFLHLPKGLYWLTATGSEHVLREPVRVQVQLDGAPTPQVELVPERAGSIQVAVDSKRFEDLWAIEPLLYASDGSYLPLKKRIEGRSPQGWTILGVPTGDYTLVLPLAPVHIRRATSASARCSLVQSVSVAAGQRAEVHFQLANDLRHQVHGTVTTDAGEPLRSYRITVRRGDIRVASWTSDWDGKFQGRVQAGRDLTVELRTPYPSQQLKRSPLRLSGLAPMELSWTLSAGSIACVLGGIDDKRRRLGISVDLVPEGGDPSLHDPERSLALNGLAEVEFRHLAAGSYTLIGWCRGQGDVGIERSQRATEPVHITIKDGEVRRDVVLKLPPKPAGGQDQ